MEEVMNVEDANLSIVISESYGLKRVIHKIYFYLDNYDECSEALKWVTNNYSEFIVPNVRIDCYKVICGRKVLSYV